ncbi:MAG: YihY/virulence factor BrkB family protein [Bacteroidetes bacterium]|nr:MAG: YihY/virulence factor BrkB family protein [Bacteroidota bacterium]
MTDNTRQQNSFSKLVTILRESFSLLKRNDPLRLAGATAFFTTFALPPIIFILAQLFGSLIGQRELNQGLIGNISEMVGTDGAKPVKQVLKSIHGFSNAWYVIIIGFLFLVFISTTLFLVIKSSLNQIWKISITDRPGFTYFLVSRTKAFAVILVTGFLFWVGIFLESMEAVAGNYLNSLMTIGIVDFKFIFSKIGSVIVIGLWFFFLFRYLAEGRPNWKACVAGSLVTSIFFMLGKWLLKALLIDTNIGKLYGASGSFVLVLLFVFYCSFILYYGACFIAIYSLKNDWPIIPKNQAYLYRIQKIKKPVE